jgi:porin
MKSLIASLAITTALLAAPAYAAEEAAAELADVSAQAVPAAAEKEASVAAGASEDEPVSLAKTLGIAGVSPRLDLTGFVQTKVAGDGDESARFTGRGDLFVDFSSEGLGLWEGTMLRTHTELLYRDTNAIGVGGALWPQNVGAVLPLSGEGIELTSFYIVQNLGKNTNLIVGKLNAVDLLAGDPFFGGWGTKRFQNLVFVAPPSGVVPPNIIGSILTHQVGDVGFTLMVFDPEDRSSAYDFDGLFSTGVNFSFGGTWTGEMGGRATSIGITGTGSTKTGSDFEDILAPPGLEGGTKKGSYNISLQFGHDLAGSVKGPSHLGVYFKTAIADGNPNLIQSSFSGGLGGHGLFAGRSRDRFGLGVYYYNFSDVLQDATDPLGEFDDEAGMEAYYLIALGGNVDLTFDAQVVDPARGENSVLMILGARLGLHF